MTRRFVLALGLALAALPTLPAAVAVADECGFPAARFQRGPARGAASAIVTRIDEPGSTGEGFRVEQTVGLKGPRPGDVVRISCAHPVPYGGSVALVYGMYADTWWVGSPWNKPTAPAPPGPAVAVASGQYGESRLVALDASGQVVAEHRRTGSYHPSAIAACPGGRTVVTVGSGGPGYPDYDYEYAVYGLDLSLRRSASIHPTGEGPLRCLDPDGAFSQRLIAGPEGSELITYGGPTDTSRPVPLPDVAGAVAVPGGFLVYRPEGSVHVDSDGNVRRFPKVDLTGRLHRLSVAPDGRTVAALTEGSFDRATGVRVPVRVVAFDLLTGDLLGRWTPSAYVDGLAWTPSGRLLAWVGYSDGRGQPPDVGRVVVLDRSLREVGTLPGSSGTRFTALGEQAVFWGDAPVSRSTPGASASVPSELRLSSTHVLISLADGVFTSDTPDGLPRVLTGEPSSDRAAAAVAGGLGVLVLVGALGAAAARVRR